MINEDNTNENVVDTNICTKQQIKDLKGDFLLFISGANCTACDMLKTTLEYLENDEEVSKLQLKIVRADVGNPEILDFLISDRNIKMIPFLVFFKDSKEIFNYLGYIEFINLKSLCLKFYGEN